MDDDRERYQKMASEFADALRVAGLLFRNPDIAQWGRDLAVLAQKHGPDQVAEALAWHIASLGKPCSVKAYSPASIGRRWRDVAAARDRQAAALPGESLISLCAREAADRIGEAQRWPPNVKVALPVLIQQSLDGWNLFLVRIKTTLAECEERTRPGYNIGGRPTPPDERHRWRRWARFLQQLLEDHGGSQFITHHWFPQLAPRFCCLEGDYLGDVTTLAFRPDGDRFRNWWRLWSDDWCCSPTDFDDLYTYLLRGK